MQGDECKWELVRCLSKAFYEWILTCLDNHQNMLKNRELAVVKPGCAVMYQRGLGSGPITDTSRNSYDFQYADGRHDDEREPIFPTTWVTASQNLCDGEARELLPDQLCNASFRWSKLACHQQKRHGTKSYCSNDAYKNDAVSDLIVDK